MYLPGGVSFELRTNENEVDKIKEKAKNHAANVVSIIENI